MTNDFFSAVALDVFGCELETHCNRADCIDNAVQEAIDDWNGWDALHAIRVFHVTHDVDGDEVWHDVHEETV